MHAVVGVCKQHALEEPSTTRMFGQSQHTLTANSHHDVCKTDPNTAGVCKQHELEQLPTPQMDSVASTCWQHTPSQGSIVPSPSLPP
jgi:hypothetical protein